MITLSDRYGDLDADDLDENRVEDGDTYFSLEPDDDKEINFDRTFQRGETRSFEADFGYQLDETLADMEDPPPDFDEGWSEEFEEISSDQFETIREEE